MKKLETEALDAIVLASAGLERLGLADRITAALPPDIMLPAVGQGALCVESRAGDTITGPLLADLEHSRTRAAVTAERAFLKKLEGGCQVPIAGYAQTTDDQVHLTGLVAELDGSTILRTSMTSQRSDAESLGLRAAEELLSRGADDILTRLQQHV